MKEGRTCYLYCVEDDGVHCYKGAYHENYNGGRLKEAIMTNVGLWDADDDDIVVLEERDDERALKALRRNNIEAMNRLVHEMTLLEVVLN